MKRTEMNLEDIDAELKKWTDRKVWMQKCELEYENADLKNEVAHLENENKALKKTLAMPGLSGYDPTKTLYEIEKEAIIKAIKFHGDKAQAAQALGTTLKTIYNKLHEYVEFEGQE